MGIFMLYGKNKEIKKKQDEDEIPFGKNEDDELIDFKCKKCGYEENVPDFVVFECYTDEDYDEESGSPIVLCPKCDSNMIIKK